MFGLLRFRPAWGPKLSPSAMFTGAWRRQGRYTSYTDVLLIGGAAQILLRLTVRLSPQGGPR